MNSVNPFRLQGQKTAAFEICDALGRAPDIHCVPVGNAGNISSHWIGYSEYLADGMIAEPPQLFGFQAQGAAPIVLGEPVKDPQTIATAIRIGNPASWDKAVDAARGSEGAIVAVTDREILAAYRRVAREGLFAEPASAASVAGLLHLHAEGKLPRGRDRRLHPHRARPEGSRSGRSPARRTPVTVPADAARPSPAELRARIGSARCASPSASPRPRPTSARASTASGWRSTSATR